MPRVLLIPDVPNWAWAHRARGIQAYAPRGYHVDITTGDSLGRYDAGLLFTWWKSRLLRSFPGVQRLWTFVADVSCMYPFTGNGPEDFAARRASAEANTDTARQLLPSYYGVITINRETIPILSNMANRLAFRRTGVDHHLYRSERVPAISGRLRVGWCGRVYKGVWNVKGYDLVLKPLMQRFAGDDRVEFVVNCRTSREALDQRSMVSWFAEIDVLLITSCTEGTPSVLLEAMSCARCALATPVGIVNEIITPGENGLVLPGYRNEHEAEAVVDAAYAAIRGLSSDRSRVLAMGRSARTTVEERWTWEQLAPEWLEVLCNC